METVLKTKLLLIRSGLKSQTDAKILSILSAYLLLYQFRLLEKRVGTALAEYSMEMQSQCKLELCLIDADKTAEKRIF